MITKLSHATIWVTDHEVAKEFYIDKLGFEVRTDFTGEGGFRWLTAGPKTQPELEISFMLIQPGPHMDEETVKSLKHLLNSGILGTGVFQTEDCQKTYEELKAKGVEFTQEPKDQFYGIEATFKDPFGNWYSLTQPKGF